MSTYEHSPWLTTRQAATYAGRNPQTVRDALADGELVGYQRTAPNGRWRIHIEDIDAWVRGERPARARLRIA